MIHLVYVNPNMEKDDERMMRSGAFSCPGSWNGELLYRIVIEDKKKEKGASKD